MKAMRLLRNIVSGIRSLFQRKRVGRELEEELRGFMDMAAEESMNQGRSDKEALRAVRLERGSPEAAKELVRSAGWESLLETSWRDLCYGLRVLRKSPGFAAVAILTLALGIGANTAIFSVMDAVLLRSLPYKNPDRLIDLTEYRPGAISAAGVSFPDYLAWKQQNTVFEESAAYFLISASNDIVLGGPTSTERERYSTVTNSFFTILGVQPAIGHGFSAADEIPSGPKVFLVGDAVWRGLFGGDPTAVGKTYLLDGENFTLVGVMPPGFDFPKGCGIWVPTSTLGTFGLNDRISHPYHVLGRLREGVSLAAAQSQIEGIQERLRRIYPKTDADWRVRAQPLLDEIIGNVRASLFILLAAVGFILLIACANVVNLMLARASTREKEFAIRAALGAGRMRLLRQNLTESFLIVGLSIVLAVLFARWGLALIVSLTSIHLPRMEEFHLSIPVLAFIAVAAVLTALLVGLAPALQASQQDPQGALRDGRCSGTGCRGQRLRSVLVVSEVALALVLLCGAGLMLRSFAQLIRVNPGFQLQHLLTLKIALPSAKYPRLEQTSAYLDQLLGHLRALPGVQSVAAASTLPLSGESDWGTFLIPGSSPPDWTKASAAGWRGVSVDYFQALGIPLLRGRGFTPADAKNQNTIIINEAMARKFWPGADPIGQQIMNRDQRNPLEVIGIVADTKGGGLGADAKPEMYTLLRGFWYAFLAVRTSQQPSAIAPMVRAQVAALDKGVPVYQVATMDQLLDRSVAPQRFDLFLLGLFAALALILAAIGIYGVLAYSVRQRTHEIGIRMALGAERADVLRMVLGQGVKLALMGVGVGLIGAFALTRFLSSLLYSVKATDPLTFIAVSLALTGVALLATYIPARRAMEVDPMVALRYE
jgi:putative ABC transport system permease protein